MKKRILVVNHDESIAEIFAMRLRHEGYKCDAVWEHEAVLRVMKRVKKNRYDLLLCHVSTLEVEKELLAWVLGSEKSTPLLVTGARLPEDVPKHIYDRCTFFRLDSSFEPEKLLAKVNAVWAQGEP
jgi:DNA-binding response OmpR family regulator